MNVWFQLEILITSWGFAECTPKKFELDTSKLYTKSPGVKKLLFIRIEIIFLRETTATYF